jgi:hypothetical protein
MAINNSAIALLTGRKKNKINREEWQTAEQDTPFGPLTNKILLPQGEGQEPTVAWCICPLAFLWQACQLSLPFLKLLQALPAGVAQPEAQPQIKVRIGMYLDDVMPGNAHRPDKGRSYVAVYWAFIDLPVWFLHACSGWFVLTFVPKKVWSNIPGEQSGMLRVLLKAFWPDAGLSFATGVTLSHGAESVSLVAEKVDVWLLDGDAVPKVTLAKTMSAFKCCCKCRTVVARIDPDKIPAGILLTFRISL